MSNDANSEPDDWEDAESIPVEIPIARAPATIMINNAPALSQPKITIKKRIVEKAEKPNTTAAVKSMTEKLRDYNSTRDNIFGSKYNSSP